MKNCINISEAQISRVDLTMKLQEQPSFQFSPTFAANLKIGNSRLTITFSYSRTAVRLTVPPVHFT